jgi:hypothetical protein
LGDFYLGDGNTMTAFDFQSPSQTELPIQTSWEDAPVASFTLSSIDFETDEDGRPTEIGLTKINLGTGRIEDAYWTRLNGGNACLQPLYPKIRPFLRDQIMLAHNRGTEVRCLFAGLVVPPPARLWVDSLNVFKGMLPLLRTYELSEVAATLGVDVMPALLEVWPEARGFGPHNALWDSAATGLALHKLISQSNLSHLTLRQLAAIMPRQGLRPKINPGEASGDWQSSVVE